MRRDATRCAGGDEMRIDHAMRRDPIESRFQIPDRRPLGTLKSPRLAYAELNSIVFRANNPE